MNRHLGKKTLAYISIVTDMTVMISYGNIQLFRTNILWLDFFLLFSIMICFYCYRDNYISNCQIEIEAIFDSHCLRLNKTEKMGKKGT